MNSVQFSLVKSLSRVRMFASPWIAAHQASCPSPTLGVYQTHVHWVSDAIQPCHPLSSPSPPALSLSHSDVFLYFFAWSLRKAFLSLLAILWNSAFRCLYLSFSPLLFYTLLFTAICKASPDSYFAIFHFFSMGMVLIPVSCTVSQTSFHSSSGTLSDLGP